jgi:HAD superfamily hydrolase (TIGR01509 family)
MIRVRAISFDYGHVLGGFDLAELSARLRALAPARAIDEVALRGALAEAFGAHDDAIGAGLGHEVGWRRLVGTLVEAAWGVGRGVPVDVAERANIDETVDAQWRAQPTRNLWRNVPDEARALLRELETRGVPMVVTSNSEGRVRELLEELGLASHFLAILDSGVLGFAKPDARIFQLAAARAGVAPAELVHIGDSERADVAGARAAGLRAIRFDGFVPGAERAPTEAEARTSSYAELRAILCDWLGLPA